MTTEQNGHVIIREEWREARGYAGYEVSSLGRIRSLDRIVTFKDGRKQFRPGKLLRPGLAVSYLTVRIFYKSRAIHRVVAETFLDNPMGLETVNHKNGVKTDNRVENLEWVSHADNIRHAFDTGLYDGHMTRQRKFSDELIADIRRAYEAGENAKSISNRTGIDLSYVCKIAKGLTRTRKLRKV